jgi:pimeloyl-ACP methyl ester carboxylesterase
MLGLAHAVAVASDGNQTLQIRRRTMNEADLIPFTLTVDQERLDDLHDRIVRTRWPQELEGAGWDYGVPVTYLRDLAEYWRTGFDWRAQEARVNAFPNLTTDIDGQRLHAIHVESASPDAVPLLLLHGWPGSIVEFLDMIDLLRGDFHLVIPSLPGFGLSGPTRERGWNTERMAKAIAELMRRLGHERYLAHGGDFGSQVARELGFLEPDRVIGLHLTELAHAAPQPGQEPRDESERAAFAVAERYQYDLSSYMWVQSQRPQTLAYGLADSPVFQLAWIAERFRDWTGSETPEDTVDRDALLANTTLYWFTDTAASSSRIYKEQAASYGQDERIGTVPTGIADTPANIGHPLRRIAEQTDNLVRWTELPRGGHFPGLEIPEQLAEDIRAFAAPLIRDMNAVRRPPSSGA